MLYLAQPTPAGASSPIVYGWGYASGLALSARDRRILLLAQHKLGGAPVGFAAAIRALREAVEELIPAGRVFLLGRGELGPIVGSIVSGVGITAGSVGVQLLRVERDGRRTPLGSFLP